MLKVPSKVVKMAGRMVKLMVELLDAKKVALKVAKMVLYLVDLMV